MLKSGKRKALNTKEEKSKSLKTTDSLEWQITNQFYNLNYEMSTMMCSKDQNYK